MFKDYNKIDILLANIHSCHVLGRTSWIFKFLLINWRHSLKFRMKWKIDVSFTSLQTLLGKWPGPCLVRGCKILWLQDAVYCSLLQWSRQLCAMIKQLKFADMGKQRNTWNTETLAHPEAGILSFQLFSGKALYPMFTAGCKPAPCVPQWRCGSSGSVDFGWQLVRWEWLCFST